ncbi:hypothetical protein VTJ49DRAFT_24 [Mycothermus thermophilus]|uniref:Uncharacterized protein n=1 Tax=Humicola insolens TaxID=85995 RepID=A0ABR3VRQ3_HUMIN
MALSQRLKTLRLLHTAIVTSWIGLGTWCMWCYLQPQCINPALSKYPIQYLTSTVGYGVIMWIMGPQQVAVFYLSFGVVAVCQVLMYFGFGVWPFRGIISLSAWFPPFAVNLLILCGCLWCAKLLRDDKAESKTE